MDMSQAHAKARTDSENANDNDWFNRGEYWLKRINPVPQYSPKTQGHSQAACFKRS